MADVHAPIHAVTGRSAEEPAIAASASLPASAQERSKFWGLALSDAEKSGNIELAIVRRVAILALFIYFGLGAILVVGASIRLIPNNWENTYPESPNVWVAMNAVQTGKLFVSYHQPPYILQSYGPLWYALNATMAWMSHAGLQPDLRDNIQHFVVHARLISFAAFLLCGILIFWIGRRLSMSIAASALGALMLIGHPWFFHSAVTVRPDLLCVALMTLSLFVAVYQESPSFQTCCLAGAIGGFACLIKQPGAGAVLSIALVWALHKRFKQTIWLFAGAAAPVILMGAFLLVHRERYALEQYLSVGKALWDLPNGLTFLANGLYNLYMLIPIGIGAVGLARALGAGERAQLLASFTLVNWVIGLSGAPQVGSAGNYLYAGLIGCGMLLPFALLALRERLKSVALLVVIILGLYHVTVLEADETHTVLAAQANFAADPYRNFAPYHILSDKPVFALYGRDPDLLDPLSLHIMEVAGNWTAAPIVANIVGSDYDFVILACSGDRSICSYRGVNFFSRDVIAAINQNYQLFCANQGNIVLTPRIRSLNAAPEIFTAAFGAPCDTKFQGHTPDLLTFGGTR
jgi:hypothetical protein